MDVKKTCVTIWLYCKLELLHDIILWHHQQLLTVIRWTHLIKWLINVISVFSCSDVLHEDASLTSFFSLHSLQGVFQSLPTSHSEQCGAMKIIDHLSIAKNTTQHAQILLYHAYNYRLQSPNCDINIILYYYVSSLLYKQKTNCAWWQ